MEYKIARVSEQPPRKWDGPHGAVYYIKVQLEGYDKPVSVGKKKPDALKVGDIIFGTIEESDLPEDKFKAAQRTEPSQTKPDEAYWQDKQAQIRAQWAIGQAVSLANHHYLVDKKAIPHEELEEWAKKLFAMVDRVKVVSETKDEVVDFDPNDKDIINLSEAPF